MTSFHTLEDWDRPFEIITGEDDPFRLVIRGYALIDERLHKVINAAFRDGTPPELRNLRLSSRLALAEALEFVRPDIKRAITALAGLRHRLAHGSDYDLTKEDLRTVNEILESLYDEIPRIETFNDGDKLTLAGARTLRVVGVRDDDARPAARARR